MNPTNFKQEHQLIGPTDAATTELTASLDTIEKDWVSIRVQLSAEANTSNAGTVISILDNTSASTTGATTVVADSTVVDNTAISQHLFEIPWGAGRERYAIVKVTPGTTVANDVIGIAVNATAYRLKVGPSSTSGMVGNTSNDTVTLA